MALEDLIRDKNPRKKKGNCPECGTEGEDTGRLEVRCPNDSCDVIHWYPSE